MKVRQFSRAAIVGTLIVMATAPCYAEASSTIGSTTVRGVVAGMDGKYDLKIHDRNGVVRDVRLHPGTVIMPRGLTLRSGMRVAVIGKESTTGAAVDAREIDAPYHIVSTTVAPGYSPFMGYSYDTGTPVRKRVVKPNN